MIARSRKRVLPLALGVTALVGVLGGTATADAGARTAKKPTASAKTQTVRQVVQLPPSGIDPSGVLDATVLCPRGTGVVGGGALFGPGTPLDASIQLLSSGPSGAGRRGNGWTARYDNDTALFRAASAEAICLKDKLKVTGADGKPTARAKFEQLTQPVMLPPSNAANNNGHGQLTLNCPKGTTLTNGAGAIFAADANVDIRLLESGPQGNGWHVRFDNDVNDTRNAQVIVICLKNKLKLKGGSGKQGKARANVEQVSMPVLLPPSGVSQGRAQFDVACPEGTAVVGGGALFAPNAPLGTNIELYESGPQGNGWHARFDNNEAVAQSASIHAVCLKNRLKVK